MDLETVKPELVAREFLAVIIAGFGAQLQPLTADYGDEPSPKALLPIANRPMIDYILSWIEKSGITDVLLICPTIHRPSIYHHINSELSSSNLNIDVQTHDEMPDSSIGTCNLLRQFAPRIKEDFVLLACDFIAPPSLPLSMLLNQFRVDSSSNGSIATTCWYPTSKAEKSTLPEEWGPLAPSIAIVWDDASRTLLHIDTADDFDRNSGEFDLKMSLLLEHPRVCLSSAYQDSHIYVCKRSVLDVLLEKSRSESFREEFLPWLCKIQYEKVKKGKYGKVLHPTPHKQTSQSIALQHSTILTFTEGNGPAEADGNITSSLKVGVVFLLSDSGFAIRVHDLHSYVEVNRRSLSTVTYALPTDPENRALIDQKVQISTDTIIGDSTRVSERTTIKKSIVGRHCIVGKMVRIVGCILLDHCVIEDGVQIDACVLGKNTRVGARAELSKCVTQAGYEVNEGDVFKNEKLETIDWTTAPSAGDSGQEDDVMSDESLLP